jgi:hypothetical protein
MERPFQRNQVYISLLPGEIFGINEALFASALAVIVFSLFACQPLTIVDVTGLIALFNYTIYDIITQYDPTICPV